MFSSFNHFSCQLSSDKIYNWNAIYRFSIKMCVSFCRITIDRIRLNRHCTSEGSRPFYLLYGPLWIRSILLRSGLTHYGQRRSDIEGRGYFWRKCTEEVGCCRQEQRRRRTRNLAMFQDAMHVSHSRWSLCYHKYHKDFTWLCFEICIVLEEMQWDMLSPGVKA